MTAHRDRRSPARRVVAVLGGTLAAGIVAGLVVFAGYASTNLEELKATMPRLGDTPRPSTVDRAADGAVGFARKMAEPAPAAPGAATYVLSAQPPAGVDAAAGRWCAPAVIGYRIDPTAARAAGSTLATERQRWRSATAAWTRASGGAYRFEYRGTASYPVDRTAGYPLDPETVPDAEIAITYATAPGSEVQVPGYVHSGLGDTLGFAGVGPVPWSSGPDQGEVDTGMVVLDAADAVADPHAVPTPYLHELGHALGLGHVADGRQVMDADASATVLGNGDRTGIRRLAALTCS